MGFGVILLWASYRVIKDALNIFMQTVPKGIDIEKVKSNLLSPKNHHLDRLSF